MFLYVKIIVHSLSSKRRNTKVFTHSDFKMALTFAIIGNIAATALNFIKNARTEENRNFIFECEKIYQLVLSLEYNSKITMGGGGYFSLDD